MSVESWRVDDAPTLSSTQTAVRNLSRLVWLILVSVFWRERLSCQSVPWGVELRSCIVSVVVEERGVVRSCRVARHTPHVQARLQAVCSTFQANNQNPGTLFATECLDFGTASAAAPGVSAASRPASERTHYSLNVGKP